MGEILARKLRRFPRSENDKEMITIYGLVDPRFELDGGLDIRYVGKTVNIHRRLHSHINKAKNGSAWYVHRWIRQLLAEGVEPSITILEEIPEGGDWTQAERDWISDLVDEDYNLTNLTEGGEGMVGYKHSDETRHRMSEAQRKRLENPEARAFLGALRKGRGHSDETRRKISESQRGRKHSDETRRKISIAAKKRLATLEGKAQMAMLNDSRTFEELSVASYKAAATKRANGYKHSDETRRNMSIARKKYYATQRGSEGG